MTMHRPSTTVTVLAVLLLIVGTLSPCISAHGATYHYSPKALPFGLDALEPHYSSATVDVHYNGHHTTYATNLNRILNEYASSATVPLPISPETDVEGIVRAIAHFKATPELAAIENGVRVNAGGVYNHDLFWACMQPTAGGGSPLPSSGALFDGVTRDHGGFGPFVAAFAASAKAVVGSGWTIAYVDHTDQKVKIRNYGIHDSPAMEGHHPILVLDVWEHAYYLQYKNKRAVFIDEWWKVVNWGYVGELYTAAKAFAGPKSEL